MATKPIPFEKLAIGGVKQIGIGREQGSVALEHYGDYKPVFIVDN
jgi:acyl-CoA reductase-like NAD-dependent aldehyde dehydrogenase